MTRAENRHHAARKKAKARLVAAQWYANAMRWGEGGPDAREIGMSARTMKRCSCPMCGHRRKHFGPPFSELRRLAA